MPGGLSVRSALALLAVGAVLALTSAGATATPAAHHAPAAPAASTDPLPPGQDPFYTYGGARPLAEIAPGTVLRQRSVAIALGGTSTPVTAEQLLYRTTDELGQPTATVTTVILPATGTAAPRLVDYLSFYDALGAQCDPSYTLRGGNPGSANQGLAQADAALIASYLANGFIVTVPDFEGTRLEWGAGHIAGYASLDALRATESYLGLPSSTEVGLTGYSGGSIAAEWASELAPSYAPELHIVGVAEGGIPVDFAHNLAYINGSSGWSGVIPAVLVSLSRAYGIDLGPFLSPYGARVTAQVAHACIGSFEGAYPGLTIQALLKPAFQNVLQIPAFTHAVDRLIMGSAPGHPAAPLFMGVGDSDGTGDGVMVTADVQALAHEYCAEGVPVQLTVYQGSDHTQAAVQFEPAAMTFLQQRFAGLPASSNCASIPVGNSLAPLPVAQGYWEAGADGGVFTFGAAGFFGSRAGQHLVGPVVGVATTADNQGYWEAASDGGVFSFGDAPFYGSMGSRHLDAPVVGMVPTADGHGYWLVAADGGVFSFGDAPFLGSGRGLVPGWVVGMAPTADGQGYWLVTSGGAVLAFGDAPDLGSVRPGSLKAPVVGIVPTADGHGYWLVAADGGVFSFGDAPFLGSMGSRRLAAPVVAMSATPDGRGYWLFGSDGGVFSFGDARFLGSGAHRILQAGITGATSD